MNLFTADIGDGKLHVYDSGNDTFHGKLPKDDIIALNIPELQSGDTLVVECAHLREAHAKTMAQAYIFDKLIELKQNSDKMGLNIKLFPQKSTPKTRKLYRGVNKETGKEFHGFEVDKKETRKFLKMYGMSPDEADTRSIAQFLLNDQNAFRSLKTFIPTKMVDFQEESQDIVDYIQEANDDINPAKSSGYGLDPKIDYYEDEVSKWIKKYSLRLTEYLDGDLELIEVIGLKFDKKGVIKVACPNRIYTLVHSILRPNGELRFRPDIGKVPNWKYIKAHYLGCKPYHMNQGVAASNYKHWMRRTVSDYDHPDKKSSNSTDFQIGMSYEELSKLKEARTKVDKMTQKIWYALRKMIIEDGLR
jgi:hypothetical protein